MATVTSVTKIFTFDAAHHLPGYDGKCSNMHGHTYKLEVTVIGRVQANGMVVDFAVLDHIVTEHLDQKYDHTVLNDALSDPTAENLALLLLSEFDYMFAVADLPQINKLRLWETPTAYTEVYNA